MGQPPPANDLEAALQKQILETPRFGALVLLLSWLCGTSALNLGLLREGGNNVAIPLFLASCLGCWLATRSLLRSRYIGRSLCWVVVGLWSGNILLAAVAGREQVYKNICFQVAVAAVGCLIFAMLIYKPGQDGTGDDPL